MPDPAAAPAPKAKTTPVSVKPWDQLRGENDLWYSRFLRYVALGPTRSVSLVAKGRRNAYPIQAHWPIVAKQNDWLKRARAFDEAARLDRGLVTAFNNLLRTFLTRASDPAETKLANGEQDRLLSELVHLEATAVAGGYQAPPDEDSDDAAPSRTSN